MLNWSIFTPSMIYFMDNLNMQNNSHYVKEKNIQIDEINSEEEDKT